MNALPFYRKRELSPRQRARVSLGLPIDAMPKTNLDSRLRQAGIREKAIEYMRLSGDDQAGKIVALHRSLNATERKAITIDHLIMASGADVHHILGVIVTEVSRIRGMQVAILLLTASPDVVRVVIKRALKPDGLRDQKLFFQLLKSASFCQPLHQTGAAVELPQSPRSQSGRYRQGIQPDQAPAGGGQ
jgi:hypothetical protein